MKKLVLALLILGAGIALAMVSFKTRPEAEKKEPEKILPTVEILAAQPGSETIAVPSQGLVEPKTVTMLATEVSGRVVSVSEKFQTGGSFDKDEELLRIDDADYKAALAQAEANLADSQLALALEEAKAEQAARDWKKLGAGKEAGPLVLRVPQLASAKARVSAAEAALEKAGRDLDRTVIRAPYASRIRARRTDLGSFVAMGTPVAEIYALAPYEIRLPLSLADVGFAKLEPGAPVVLRSALGDRDATWEGTFVRREGEIDRASRSLYLVVEVSPVEEDAADSLQPGLFLQAALPGKTLEKVFRIPRRAFLDDDTVLLVDADNRIEFRDVRVARIDDRDALVLSGIEPGERICTTALSSPVAGMEVEVVDNKSGASELPPKE